MSTATVPAPLLLEARTTTHRVARTFSLACRLLPRAVRDAYGIRYLRAAAKHHTNRYFARARG